LRKLEKKYGKATYKGGLRSLTSFSLNKNKAGGVKNVLDRNKQALLKPNYDVKSFIYALKFLKKKKFLD